jgi:hypothetical protein
MVIVFSTHNRKFPLITHQKISMQNKTKQNKLFYQKLSIYQSLRSILKKLSLMFYNEPSQSNHLEHDMSYLCKSSYTVNLGMTGLDSP